MTPMPWWLRSPRTRPHAAPPETTSKPGWRLPSRRPSCRRPAAGAERGTAPTPPILREPAADDAPEPGLTQAVLGIAPRDSARDTQALGPDVQQMLFGGQAFVDTAVFSVRETTELSGAAPGFRNTSAADPTVAADRPGP